MRARPCRLVLAGIFAALLPLAAHAGDILLNSDFRDGKTHWHGAGEEPTNMGGKILVKLDPQKWSVIYQNLNEKSSALQLTIIYTLSADCTLQPSSRNSVAVLTDRDLNSAVGLENVFGSISVTGSAVGVAFVVSDGSLLGSTSIEPSMNDSRYAAATARHTFTGPLLSNVDNFQRSEFCLAFPPGEGTVTLVKVALTKTGN